MRSRSVIVIQIRTKDTTKRAYMEHELVQALAPNRTNDALHVGPLPGGSRAAQHFVDTHVSHLPGRHRRRQHRGRAAGSAEVDQRGTLLAVAVRVHSAVGWAVTLK